MLWYNTKHRIQAEGLVVRCKEGTTDDTGPVPESVSSVYECTGVPNGVVTLTRESPDPGFLGSWSPEDVLPLSKPGLPLKSVVRSEDG